ncbi:hypothetical protein [Bdellovibrio sp. HCB2-146]|uniref:hypothetical protein n=1 Tax=Bdellovibrio sp. HCB2-146 TaxID=3394362 RepID=UPI0039BC509B
MKASNQKTFTVLFLVSMALFMTACGSSSQESSYDFSSRTPVTPDSSTSTDTKTDSTQYIATCNEGAKADLGAKLKMYVDGYNQYRMDLVQIRMTSLPSDFAVNGSYIGFWKWLAQSTGSTHMAGYPLNFIVIDSQTNQALTGWRTTLLWDDVKAKASQMGIKNSADFFKRAKIVVDLQTAEDAYKVTEYDALKIVSYNRSTQKPALQLDVLLPPFNANPADYAKESSGAARASVLQNLHPLKAYANQGYTSAQLLSATKSFCF